MLAQAGIANKKLSDAVKEFGLHFAPDPSSQSVSTLGGNIAENAGGPHTLKYGVTVQHILGLTLVDPTGEIVRFGGKVASMPGLDFIGILVGSEGTMGVVTEAWVKLVPMPTSVATMLISFDSVRAATQTVADIIAEGTIPAALEMMDKGIMIAVSAAFGLTYPPSSEALLLIECDSTEPLPDSADCVREEAAVVERICLANGALEVRLAKDEAERAQLWTARKKGVGAMGRLAPTVVTHDGVIPRSKLPEMLDYVYKVSADLQIGVANIFHAGDGNLHPIFYFDERDPDQIRRVIEAGELLMRRCIDLGGSITGEHGVGIEKSDLMRLMFSETDMDLQMDVRGIFNRGAICNPCKIIPDQKSCVEHKSRWRGMAW
jgi:glycolate oxidase subunit GlcD